MNMKRLFLAGIAITAITPILSVQVESAGWAVTLANNLRQLPGIDSIASYGKYPVSQAFGIASALFLAAINTLLFLLTSQGVDTARARIERRSLATRLLYVVFALIIVTVPWLIGGGDPRPHQFSYGFFRMIGSSIFAFGLFSAGIYIYTFSLLVLITIVAFAKMGEKNER
jgi:hypothetical protein